MNNTGFGRAVDVARTGIASCVQGDGRPATAPTCQQQTAAIGCWGNGADVIALRRPIHPCFDAIGQKDFPCTVLRLRGERQ
eukprot:scaffold118490_cov31-Tisochrysis_lutea.AAC.3